MKKRTIADFIAVMIASVFFALTMSDNALAIQVPELDPGMAASGIALFAGGAFLIVERVRRHGR